MDEYEVYEQEKFTILRLFHKGNKYGEPFVLALSVSYYGKYNTIAVLEGLDKTLTGAHRRAIAEYFAKKGVRQVKWDHKDKHICLDVVEQQLRIE